MLGITRRIMQIEWIKGSDRRRLLLFFNGWGMEAQAVAHLQGEADVAILSDYRTLALPSDEVEKWKEEQAEKIKAKIPKVDCTPTVSLSALADSSIVVTIRAWTRSEFYWGVLYDVNEKIYKEFPKNGLSFPYPQMDIHVTQGA